MISSISSAFANTTTDPNAIYVLIIGIVVLFFIILASSGTSAKKVVKKYYCPHCHRQINYTAPQIRPIQQNPRSTRGQVNKPPFSNRPKAMYPRVNAPVQKRGSKKYCPYCKKEIIGNWESGTRTIISTRSDDGKVFTTWPFDRKKPIRNESKRHTLPFMCDS